MFAEVRAQGQERRHGRRRRRRRYRDVPSASFRQTFCLNRGNPTQEGEQVGVAFLLVTFLWPRKEKSLAKPRSGGETPSRTESSCPARRSRAIEAWGSIRQAMPLPTPHPSPLPQGERGSNRSLRGWRAKPRRGPRPRVLRGEAVPFTRGTTLHPAMPLPTPHPLPQGERGWLPRTITLR